MEFVPGVASKYNKSTTALADPTAKEAATRVTIIVNNSRVYLGFILAGKGMKCR